MIAILGVICFYGIVPKKRGEFIRKFFLIAAIILFCFSVFFATAQAVGDLALNKPIVSVSSTSSGSSPANCVDGNPATFWTSGSGGAQWLGIDLGQTTSIGTVVVKWGTNTATNYNIELSDDGVGYTVVRSGINGDFNSSILGSGRYILIRTIAGSNSSNYQLASLEVYVAPPPTLTPTPTITPIPTATPTPIQSGPTPTPTKTTTQTSTTSATTTTATPSATTAPTAVPTPTPVHCTLNTVSWSNATTTEGSPIGITVNGTNCSGQTVNLEVRRYGSTLIDDILANKPASPTNVTFATGANIITSSWIAERVCLVQLFGICSGDPTYYVKATVNGISIDNKASKITVTSVTAGTGPQITNVTDNTSIYPNSQVPKYSKYELTFNINNTVATNLQFPYDENPPASMSAKIGISVDGLFSNDNWATTITQPGFLYQDYEQTMQGTREHLYPKGNPIWKVRFGPKDVGTYHYKIKVTDASGTTYYPASGDLSFIVSNPQAGNHGFIQVSQKDKRYFEFSDGTPFTGLGVNTGGLDVKRTLGEMDQQLTKLSDSGLSLIRIWMSGASIAGSSWSPWIWFGGPWYGGYLPNNSIRVNPQKDPTNALYNPTASTEDYVFRVAYSPPATSPACLFTGWLNPPTSVRPSTKYHFKIRALAENITGPRNTAKTNYGLTLKNAGWPSSNDPNTCPDQIASVAALTPYIKNNGWQTVEADYTTGATQQFIDHLFLVMDNANVGSAANVTEISMKEVLSGGSLGSELLVKTKSDMHMDYNLQESWKWDYLLDKAAQKNIYLKTVVLEKNDRVWNLIAPDGTMDPNGESDSKKNVNYYSHTYANGDNNKVRRLEEYFWRYLAARWGYSTAVHSWELNNEADPFNGNHYNLANSFAKFMHKTEPERHLVSTSNWHSFPVLEFWGNPSYPDIDYADVHNYINIGTYNWSPPSGTFLETNPANVMGGQGGSIRVPAVGKASASVSYPVKAQGTWNISVWMKTDNYTGVCPYSAPANMAGPFLRINLDGTGSFTRNIPYSTADPNKYYICTNNFTGTNNWTKFSGTFDIPDNNYHNLRVGFDASFGTSGTAWFDNLELTSPDGRKVYFFGDGTFDDQARIDLDTAAYTQSISQRYSVLSPMGAGKPTIRGEAGISNPATGGEWTDMAKDTQGIWLHKWVWGQINPGGMYDLFWWLDAINKNNLWGQFKSFSNFMNGIAVNNGNYQDISASVSNINLRAWGQKDIVNGKAHLWIDNKTHNWQNVVKEATGSAGLVILQSGTVTIPGLAQNNYTVSWFDTYAGSVVKTENLIVGSDGIATLNISNLASDVAVKLDKISTQPPTATPTSIPTPTPIQSGPTPTAIPTPTPTPLQQTIGPKPMPLISRNLPVSASIGKASDAIDTSYGSTFWTATPSAWLAIDVSSVAVSKKAKILFLWLNDVLNANYDDTITNTSYNGVPSAYTIEANSAAGGGSAPATGWVNLVSVTNNPYHSRQHLLDLTGYNWLRMNITGVRDSYGGTQTKINVDLYDASLGLEDDWIFYGDSWVAYGLSHGMMGTTGNLSQLINSANNNYYPLFEAAGNGGASSTHAVAKINTWLPIFPGKYVILAFGTGDAINSITPSVYSANMSALIQAVVTAGKIPVVPKVPWGADVKIQANVPALNAEINKLYTTFPQIVKGPDLWTFFQNNPSLITTDGIHPTNQEGYVALRQQWVNTMLANVYQIAVSTPSATPTSTPTPTPTPTPVPCALNTASWSTITTTQGSTVNLNVVGNTNCAGKQVSFEVRRNGVTIDDIAANIQPQTASMSASLQATTTWTAERNPLIPFTDAQYYFKATPQGGAAISTKPQLLTVTSGASQTGPQIASITDNKSAYSNSQVPKFEKLEITFQVNNTVAKNLQMPFDPSPPPGIATASGITVNGEFSQDNFQTVYTQPAFYYQDFDYQVKASKDWIYPTNNYSWKVRFTPNKEGNWQYRLTTRDASGSSVSPTQTFTVASNPNNHGFVKVSQKDKRYFEYEDGTYFPGLGYNMNYRQISWINPVQDNQQNFQIMKQNGIQYIRHWLVQWPIWGESGNSWNSITHTDNKHLQAFDSRVPDFKPYPGSDFSMVLQTGWNPTMFIGWESQPPAVKPGTKYHIAVRYLIPQDFSGPNTTGLPYGLTVKLGDWINNVYDPGTGTVVAGYASTVTRDTNGKPTWATLQGEFTTSANQDFLQYPNQFLYVVLENTVNNFPTGGVFAYIDRVDVQEDLGGGQYGVNIIPKPWMAHHQYFSQQNSYRFDKVMDQLSQNDIYLKLSLMDHNDFILNSFDQNGNTVAYDAGCVQGNCHYYGNWRNMTKSRWYEQSWWRYVQARWGYSPNIQSWELNNEGDPFNGLHYTLADEFGKYMHQFGPNSHLTGTSFWHSIPYDEFWNNTNYPNVDFVDSHLVYKQPGTTDTIRVDYKGTVQSPTLYVPGDFYDTALYNYKAGQLYGTLSQYGVNKPVTRGESGFFTGDAKSSQAGLFAADTQAIWLHKWIWGMINPFGLYDSSYWYPNSHIYSSPDGYKNFTFDHRDQFGKYYNFIKDIPLSNGNYKDASASASNTNLRAWGQKDIVNGKAHLWIDNKTHTWGNVVKEATGSAGLIIPQSGTVTIPGMPQNNYTVSWYDTYAGNVTKTENLIVGSNGIVTLNISNLASDVAVKLDKVVTTPCTLTSASWSTTTTTQGSSVNLNVTGNSSCTNQAVTFTVVRNGASTTGGNDVSIQPNPQVVNIASGSASTSWKVEHNPLILGTNPQYYFTASIAGGNTINTQANLLTVTTNPVPTPTPTVIPTPTAIPGAFSYGLTKMQNIESLPYLQNNIRVGGQSSFDRTGGNNDMGNLLYLEGTERVILDLKGPGTVSRMWATSLIGTQPGFASDYLKVYFDGETTPRLNILLQDLFSGTNSPFMAPLVGNATVSSGGFYSYLPLSFAKSIKIVTNSTYYYNIGYELYGTDTNITSWTGNEDSTSIRNIWNNVSLDPKLDIGNITANGNVNLVAGNAQTLFETSGPRSISSIRLKIPSVQGTIPQGSQFNEAKDILNNINLRIYWDNGTTPSVDAPLGAFFALGQFGPYATKGLLVGIDTNGYLYAYFPMPFKNYVKIQLVSARSIDTNNIIYEIKHKPFTDSFDNIGNFKTQFNHLFPTAGDNQDIVFLDTEGSGNFLGVVQSINTLDNHYYEGDERIYLDDNSSPVIYGTGLEDFYNGGWYFFNGPFTKPLHGNTIKTAGSTYQLTAYRFFQPDMIPFQKHLRVGIEHGSRNSISGEDWSLAYYYYKPATRMIVSDTLDVGDTTSENSHAYIASNSTLGSLVTSTYDGNFDNVTISDTGRTITTNSKFTVSISATNTGVLLRRMFDQSVARQQAQVYVDGTLVGTWYTAGNNQTHRWKDDDFIIPSAATKGKSKLDIEIRPSGNWNEYKYTVYSYQNASIAPTPTPTPTPTPVPCALASAAWSTTTTTQGSTVNLNVAGNSSCAGKQVSFEVRRNGTLIDDISANIQPQSASMSATSQASATWKAERNPLIPFTDAQYYFKATPQGGAAINTKPQLLTVTQAVIVPTSPTDWPQVQKDPQHTGYSSETLGTNFKVKFTYAFQPDRIYPQVQAIIYQGKAYVGTEGANGQKPTLYAIDAVNPDSVIASKGKVIWKFEAGGPIVNSVAAYDNKIFFGSLDGAVYALNSSNGQQVWKQQLSQRLGFVTAPVIADNKIMLGGQDGNFYALDPNSGNVIWKYNVGRPILQTAAFDQGKIFFGAMNMNVYGLNTTNGALVWKSSRIPGQAFKDYWPIVTQGKVFIIPQAQKVDLGIWPGYPFGWNMADANWLAQNGAAIAAGNASSVTSFMDAQNTVMAKYQTNPASFTKNMYILDENTGQEATVVPHWSAQTHSGTTTPPCVDKEGKLIVPVYFIMSGWGRLDLSQQRITDVLYDGYGTDGKPFGSSTARAAGFGNIDENLNVTCSSNLIFGIHTQEGNANYTGAFDQVNRRWTKILAGGTNGQMSSNTQGGGGNPVSVSNGLIYHISGHELIVRTTN